jgi:cytochrome c-type biogenesis protein
MDSASSVGFLLAFGAGLLSFLSPCVLPLVPSYVSFITGMSFEELGERRHSALVQAVLFVSGFTLIFMLLGAGATGVGRLLNIHQVWLERVGGALVIVFGLYLLGVFNWGVFARERRIHLQNKPVGYLGSLLVGVAFGAGWTPCIGPILGSILLFTTSQADLGKGMVLLFSYSLGLAVPFLIAAVAVDRFAGWFQRYRRFMPLVTKVSGGLLVAGGLLLVSGYFTALAGYLQGLTPEFIRSRI